MGLRITGYNNLKIVKKDDDFIFKAKQLIPEWDNRMSELEYGKYYVGDEIDYITYSCTYHSSFRTSLLKKLYNDDIENFTDIFVDYNYSDELYKNIPFIKLINFTDTNGIMDNKTTKELLIEFKKYYDIIKNNKDWYFVSNYKNWLDLLTKVVENDGILVFS